MRELDFFRELMAKDPPRCRRRRILKPGAIRKLTMSIESECEVSDNMTHLLNILI